MFMAEPHFLQDAELHKNNLIAAFLSNVSHEIRTPINGVLGFAELLKDPQLNLEEKETYLGIIINSTHQLLSVIDDILTMSQIDTGQLPVQTSIVNLQVVFKEIHSHFMPLAIETKNEISFSIDADSAYNSFICDELKLKQTLIHLLKNALKFTSGGLVKFGAMKEEEGIRFYVEDNGIGISSEHISYIFQRFGQVHQKNQENCTGIGLGLSIAQKLVELMGGGALNVESEPSKGSVFYFRLPFQ
jgi:signal transduction histidine kinase